MFEYLPFSSLLREYNLHLLQIPPLFHYLQGIVQPLRARRAGLAQPPLPPYLSPAGPGTLLGTTFTAVMRLKKAPPTFAWTYRLCEIKT